MLPLNIEEIADLNLWKPWFKTAPLNQTIHRVRLAQAWDIPEGSHVLELGCGQGDCTVVLAAAVGDNGHVTGVDPASLDYGAFVCACLYEQGHQITNFCKNPGSPSTLGQAQSHLKQSKFGSRMVFVQASSVDFIATPGNENKFDTVVLAHCIYYMSSPTTLLNIFQAIQDKAPSIKRLCIAEYALSASIPEAYPHVLAVLMEAALEVHKDGEASESNVRTVVGPKEVTRLANAAGWTVHREGILIPDSGLEDGRWEISAALGVSDETISGLISGERERALVGAMRESVSQAVDKLDGKKNARTMDVWWSVFTRAE
ncbi:hypothetical protein FRC09_014359 [Ceratobasidium sp. 395]|nr:hypothetical protein FRC09_014359 [Ceratobasidium sp. 395]